MAEYKEIMPGVYQILPSQDMQSIQASEKRIEKMREKLKLYGQAYRNESEALPRS